MHNNLRSGVRHAKKHVLALSQAAPVVRTQIGCASCSTPRGIAQSASKQRAIPFSLNSYSALPDERDERIVRMLMFGKPGAGKGTLTARLVRKYNILSLSTGDLLRQHIAERTSVGLEAEEIMARGELLPDEMVLKIVTSKLDSLQNKVCIPFDHRCLLVYRILFLYTDSFRVVSSALDSGWLPAHTCTGRIVRCTLKVGAHL